MRLISAKWVILLGLIGLVYVLLLFSVGGMAPDTEDKGKLCLRIAGHVWPRPYISYFAYGLFALLSTALVALFAAHRRSWILAVPIVVAPLYVPQHFVFQCGQIIP